jgi:O-methyltransferase involved in polyketide biosynthesis
MDNKTITLNEEKETLLIPLYGKAMETFKKAPILSDSKALEIVGKIHYDFKSLKIPVKTNTMMCLRAKIIDTFVISVLNNEKDSVVLHLGCGLDSRYVRVNNPDVDWYDLDYKEVIDIRRNFYPNTEKYHLIPSSITESQWIDIIPKEHKQYLVIAEGLFMYLKENEIKEILLSIKKRIGHYTLILDAFSVFAARKANNHPSIKKTGAKIYWGIDDPIELTKWDQGIHFLKEIYFTSNDVVENFKPGTKLMYKIANLIPLARTAQRILIFRIE